MPASQEDAAQSGAGVVRLRFVPTFGESTNQNRWGEDLRVLAPCETVTEAWSLGFDS